MGEPDSALEFAHRALAIAEAQQEPRLYALSVRRLGKVYHVLGNYPRAEDFLRTAAVEGDRSREQLSQVGLPSVISRVYLVYCLSERGEFIEGMARGEEAIRIAQSADSPISLIGAYDSLGRSTCAKGISPGPFPSLNAASNSARRPASRAGFPQLPPT